MQLNQERLMIAISTVPSVHMSHLAGQRNTNKKDLQHKIKPILQISAHEEIY